MIWNNKNPVIIIIALFIVTAVCQANNAAYQACCNAIRSRKIAAHLLSKPCYKKDSWNYRSALCNNWIDSIKISRQKPDRDYLVDYVERPEVERNYSVLLYTAMQQNKEFLSFVGDVICDRVKYEDVIVLYSILQCWPIIRLLCKDNRFLTSIYEATYKRQDKGEGIRTLISYVIGQNIDNQAYQSEDFDAYKILDKIDNLDMQAPDYDFAYTEWIDNVNGLDDQNNRFINPNLHRQLDYKGLKVFYEMLECPHKKRSIEERYLLWARDGNNTQLNYLIHQAEILVYLMQRNELFRENFTSALSGNKNIDKTVLRNMIYLLVNRIPFSSIHGSTKYNHTNSYIDNLDYRKKAHATEFVFNQVLHKVPYDFEIWPGNLLDYREFLLENDKEE